MMTNVIDGMNEVYKNNEVCFSSTLYKASTLNFLVLLPYVIRSEHDLGWHQG